MSAVTTVSAFQKDAEPRIFSAGDIIFKAGEVGDEMFGIIEGEVEIQVNGVVVEVIRQGDVFGEGALVQPSYRRASNAIATTDCKLAIMTKNRFLFAVQNTPMFAIELMRSFSSRLRSMKTEMALTQNIS